MRKIRTTLLVIVILFFWLQPGCKKPVATDLPNVNLMDLEGKVVSLAEFAGKPLVINFWATWCGPCRIEIPMLNELQKKYASSGLVIVGISTDEDGAGAVKPFLKEIPIEYANYLKGPDTEEKFGGVWALPTNLFFDRSGKQVDKVIGIQPREAIEQRIQQLVKN